MELSNRHAVESKAARLKSFFGSGSKQNLNLTTIYTSIGVKTDSVDLIEKHRKLDALMGKMNTSPVVKRGGPGRRKRQKESLQNGWYEIGWKKKNVYTTSDLLLYFNILWKQHFSGEPPRPNWYLRKHLLGWLKADGYKKVEAIFDFAFDHWDTLRRRFSIDADEPSVNLIYGYRRSFWGEMTRGAKGKKWAPKWSQEETTCEFSAESIVI